jgi:hypothetical protein
VRTLWFSDINVPQCIARWTFLVVALWAWSAYPALAALCGDDVDGQDVPCSCGDVVVSDLALGDDPVASATCPSDGLLVDARKLDRGLLIDLRGRTLRGSGRGTGVWVLNGGPGGAHVTSSGGPARIEGFEDGVVARGGDALLLLENLQVERTSRDGVRVQGDGYTIRMLEVVSAGRDGFSLSGRRYAIENTRASGSKRFGYMGMGVDGRFGAPNAGNEAVDNGKAGFNLMGSGHRLSACIARANGSDGFKLMGNRVEIASCVAEANKEDGISGTGGEWLVVANRGIGNGNDGIVIRGMGISDAGGNYGEGNRGERRKDEAVQCEIGDAPCRTDAPSGSPPQAGEK